MKRLFILAALILSLASSSPVEAQKRTRKKPRKISQEEAMVLAEIEAFWRDELEAINRLDPIQRTLVSSVIESLLRACRLYKVTGDLKRVEDDFYTDGNIAILKRARASLPQGNVRGFIDHSITALNDAMTLQESYFNGREVSNSEVLKIVERYDIEDKPQFQRVPLIMAAAHENAREARKYAIRAGILVDEK